MNSIESFVNSLDLPFSGKLQGVSYIIDLKNSDDFSKLYNFISTDGKFELVDNDSAATENNAIFTFIYDGYEFKFTADFKSDFYRLIIMRR